MFGPGSCRGSTSSQPNANILLALPPCIIPINLLYLSCREREGSRREPKESHPMYNPQGTPIFDPATGRVSIDLNNAVSTDEELVYAECRRCHGQREVSD